MVCALGGEMSDGNQVHIIYDLTVRKIGTDIYLTGLLQLAVIDTQPVAARAISYKTIYHRCTLVKCLLS